MARRHRAALAAGSLLSVAALLPPAIGFADRRLSLHMLLQMLLLALVIPLLAYGAQPLIGGSLARLHPIAGILALNVVLFGSQLPAVLDLTAKHLMLGEAAQAAFMTGAFLFWSPIVRPGGLTPIAKIGYLMVAGVPPTIPGITLALSHHLFYQAYRSIEDQQIAGRRNVRHPLADAGSAAGTAGLGGSGAGAPGPSAQRTGLVAPTRRRAAGGSRPSPDTGSGRPLAAIV
ncbi:MAG: hypothetical protein E6I24_05160 [Chloroflexi bacterium]|nr:MAG: hypothetical protein E6I24_05160 [Chloroflexota bacterium]